MRFDDIELTEFMMNDDRGSFYADGTDELIEAANEVRVAAGMEDILSPDYEGFTQFKFYVDMNAKSQTAAINFVVQNSYQDSEAEYEVPLDRDEAKNLFKKGMDTLVKEYEEYPSGEIEEFLDLAKDYGYSVPEKESSYPSDPYDLDEYWNKTSIDNDALVLDDDEPAKKPSVLKETDVAKRTKEVLKNFGLSLDRDWGDMGLHITFPFKGIDIRAKLPYASGNPIEQKYADTLAQQVIDTADNYEPMASYDVIHLGKVFIPEAHAIEQSAQQLKDHLNVVANVLSEEFDIPRDRDALGLDMSVKKWLETTRALDDYCSVDLMPPVNEDMPESITFRDVQRHGSKALVELEEYLSPGVDLLNFEEVMEATVKARTDREFARDLDDIKRIFEKNDLAISAGRYGITLIPTPLADEGPEIPFSTARNVKDLIRDIYDLEEKYPLGTMTGLLGMYDHSEMDNAHDTAKEVIRNIGASIDEIEAKYPNIIFEIDMDRQANEVSMRKLDYALGLLIEDDPKKTPTVADIKAQHKAATAPKVNKNKNRTIAD